MAARVCQTSVRAVRLAWGLALVWLGVFAVWLTAAVAPIRAQMMGPAASLRMEPFEVSSRGLVVVLVLFVVGHAVPTLLGPRRLAPRFELELGGARDYRSPAEQRRTLSNGDALACAADARRALACSAAVASALGIAFVGYFILRFSFHGPYQDPLEFLGYFYASLVVLATHAPRVMGGRSPPDAGLEARSEAAIRRRADEARCEEERRKADLAPSSVTIISIPDAP